MRVFNGSVDCWPRIRQGKVWVWLFIWRCSDSVLWVWKRRRHSYQIYYVWKLLLYFPRLWIQPWVFFQAQTGFIPLEKNCTLWRVVNLIIYPLSKYYFHIFPCKIKTKKVKAKAKMFGEWIIMITRITFFMYSKQIMNMNRLIKFLTVAVFMLCLSTIYLLFFIY